MVYKTRKLHTLADIAVLVAVTELNSFVNAGGGTGGNRSPEATYMRIKSAVDLRIQERGDAAGNDGVRRGWTWLYARGDILRRPRVALAAHLVKHDGADMRLGRLPHAIYPSALADQASLPPADILPSSSESARTFSGVEVDLDGGVAARVEDLCIGE